jgi:hypothetical protein
MKAFQETAMEISADLKNKWSSVYCL